MASGIATSMVLAPRREADPTRRYIAGGAGPTYANVPAVLPRHFDDAVRQHGVGVYDSILNDAAAHACFETVKQGLLADGIRLNPRIPGDPRLPAEKQEPAARRSKEILEFCQRLLGRLMNARAIDEVIYELADAMAFGCKLGELVWRDETEGPDAGKLVLEAIEIRPNKAWAFAVDEFFRVVGIVGLIPSEPGSATPAAGYQLIDPAKFVYFSWLPREGDPRGTSLLRAAYDPWMRKQNTRPLHYKTLYQFGRPRIVHKLPPAPANPFQRRADGSADTSLARTTAYADAEVALKGFEAGSYMIAPAGSDTLLVEAKTDGSAFIDSMSADDGQIALAIMQNTRTLFESKFGSRADSQTGQDVTRQVQNFCRRRVAHCIESQVLYRAILYNFGRSDAETHTPRATFGNSSREDFASNAQAVAQLTKSGYLQDDQKAWIDGELLGIEPRLPQDSANNPQLAPGGPQPPPKPAPRRDNAARIVYLGRKEPHFLVPVRAA